MRDTSEATWWRKTRQLAVGIIVGVTALSLVALATASDGSPVFDLPLGTFLAIIVAPLAIMVATFVFAGRQQRLDRYHDVAED